MDSILPSFSNVTIWTYQHGTIWYGTIPVRSSLGFDSETGFCVKIGADSGWLSILFGRSSGDDIVVVKNSAGVSVESRAGTGAPLFGANDAVLAILAEAGIGRADMERLSAMACDALA